MMVTEISVWKRDFIKGDGKDKTALVGDHWDLTHSVFVRTLLLLVS